MSTPTLMTTKQEIQQRIDQIKPLLEEAEDRYAHAFASGDMDAIPATKAEVAKYRRMIGALIKDKLALMRY